MSKTIREWYDKYKYGIKIFSKQQHRKEFINGKLFFRESGYFSKIESLNNDFRGDKYDSKCVSFDEKVLINNQPFIITEFIQGFVGDDKIPIFCFTHLNDDVCTINIDNSIILKQDICEELNKFGKYAVLFNIQELLENVNITCERYGIKAYHKMIDYIDNDYKNDSIYKGSAFNKYFIKREKYKKQNEYRILLLDNNCKNKIFKPLIEKDQTSYDLFIKPIRVIEFDSIHLKTMEISLE